MSKLNVNSKIKTIIDELNATDYELFDGSKDDAMDFLSRQLIAFPKYANIVIKEQIMTPIWRNRCEGQDLRDRIQDMDSKRRICHENAISATNILNRLSKNLNLPAFADIDTADRHAVAEFVGGFVNEMYNNGIGNTFDDATYQKSSEYDEGKMKNELEKLDKSYAAIQLNEEGKQLEVL